MKKNVIIIIVVMTFFIIKILPCFLPTKFAISENDLNKKCNYIICERGDCAGDGSEWKLLSDNNTVYENNIYIRVKGIENPGNIYGAYGFEDTNSFIFYGEFDECTKYENIKTFNAESWDVLYPVRREFFLDILIPDRYLCLYDTKYMIEDHLELFNKVYIWNYKSFVPENSK